MFNYEVGGNAVKVDASEGMADIPMNRSLFVQKLTDEPPTKPQAVYDLKTVDEVFNHFKPKVSLDFEDQEGNTRSEQLHFTNLGDFKAQSMVAQSPFLQGLNSQKDDYQKIMKQLKTNKQLQTVIENPEMKEAFVQALHALIQELDDNK